MSAAQPAPQAPRAGVPPLAEQPAAKAPDGKAPDPAAKAPDGAAPAAKAASGPIIKKPAKVTSVCPGSKILPLAMGNTWTYESVAAPTTPPENMAKMLPLRAKQIVVTVTGVDKKGDETTVKLTEKITYDVSKDPKTPKHFEQTVESSIVCTPKGKFNISPEAFFFAGEPGGYRGLAFTKFERKKETSLKFTNGSIGEQEWIEEIAADYEKHATKDSNAKLGKGKLEMERKYTPQHPESIATRMGTFHNTEKLGVTTTGRIRLDGMVAPDGKPCVTKKLVPAPAPKPGEERKPGDPTQVEISEATEVCELPANWISTLWFFENIGVVQTLNTYAHQYQLVEMKVN